MDNMELLKVSKSVKKAERDIKQVDLQIMKGFDVHRRLLQTFKSGMLLTKIDWFK